MWRRARGSRRRGRASGERRCRSPVWRPSSGVCAVPGRHRSRTATFLRSVRPGEPGADRVGSGVAQTVDLVGGRGAGLHRPAAGDAQLAERLDRPVPALGVTVASPDEHRSSGGFGIDGVGLAAPPALLTVRSVHLHHAHAASSEMRARPAPHDPHPSTPTATSSPWTATRPAVVDSRARVSGTTRCRGAGRCCRSPPRRGRLCECRRRRSPTVAGPCRSWSCRLFLEG